MKTGILFTLLLLAGYAPTSAQVAIIANKSVPEKSLTAAQLFDICILGTRAWSNGQAIVLVCLRDNPQEEAAFYDYLHRTPLEMRKIWLRAQLSGQARPPLMVSSQEELVRIVASTPGAIGFVSADHVGTSVKVLLTIEE